eukprot:TRINITY_DN71262_c0_g1_i1.p1 TRINITY_DN71262_c0_g1~~TRINITY_DN71262_c0_g1_i1.p1  ORF type:complete len:623 (+),score=145.64 TRINITY_DN71262_c0_g1_i1:92-1870(+)
MAPKERQGRTRTRLRARARGPSPIRHARGPSHAVVSASSAANITAFILSVPILLLGLLVILGSPVIVLMTGTAGWIRIGFYNFLGYVIIAPLRWFLDTVATYLYMAWWLPGRTHISQDSRPVLEHCATGELQWYGNHEREWLQAVHPTGAGMRALLGQDAASESQMSPRWASDCASPATQPCRTPNNASAPGTPREGTVSSGPNGLQRLQEPVDDDQSALGLLLALGCTVSGVTRERLKEQGVLTGEDLMRCSPKDLDLLGLRIGDRNRVLSRTRRNHSEHCWACGVTLGATSHVVYAPGGGFIAANATLLMGSVTPYARAGCTVWCVNYPLAPISRFPAAVVSFLRALDFLRRRHGVERCALLGDSAGGGVVSVACALVCNRHLLVDLARSLPPALSHLDIESWAFPEITGMCSLYGVLDSSSWIDHRSNAPTSTPEGLAGVPMSPMPSGQVKKVKILSRMERVLSAFALDFIFWAIDDGGKVLQGRRTFCDLIPHMKQYPPTFLICGTVDVLIYSSVRADRMLRQEGFPCKFIQYQARHAFVGFPPQLRVLRHPCSPEKRLGYLKHAKPATEQVIQFLHDPAAFVGAGYL